MLNKDGECVVFLIFVPFYSSLYSTTTAHSLLVVFIFLCCHFSG